jgi:uncharacterized protein YjbI with pentapeptide repeats
MHRSTPWPWHWSICVGAIPGKAGDKRWCRRMRVRAPPAGPSARIAGSGNVFRSPGGPPNGRGGRVFLRADLTAAQLQGANLWGAQLQGASLEDVQLQGASLVNAQLQGASLEGAQLQGALLANAQLQGAYLNSARLQGAWLNGAQLQGAWLNGAQLQGASLHAQLQGASLEGAQLQGASLEGAKLQGAWLTGAKLQGANLRRAQLQGVSFEGAFLWRAQLQDAVPENIFYRNGEIHWGPENIFYPNGGIHWDPFQYALPETPWTDSTYAAFREFIEHEVPEGELRNRALIRVSGLDCTKKGNTLASCDPSAAMPNIVEQWKKKIEAANVDWGSYKNALAAILGDLVCTDDPDRIYVLRGLLRRGHLYEIDLERSGLLKRFTSTECPVSAALTDADKGAIAALKRMSSP